MRCVLLTHQARWGLCHRSCSGGPRWRLTSSAFAPLASSRKVSILPRPLTSTSRLSSKEVGKSSRAAVSAVRCTAPWTPVDSILLAMFTLSPKRQYRARVRPTAGAGESDAAQHTKNAQRTYSARQ